MQRPSFLLACGLALAACAPTSPDRPAFRPASRAAHGSGGPGTAPAPPSTSDPSPASGEPSREGWNEAQIAWVSYERGLERARTENKPILLVMHADWCVHCRNYSHVFEDPRVVERARDFVMVRVDVDDEEEVARRYALDGGYVPRTYFLAPDGTPRPDVDARRARFRYFYDENDPTSLLSSMDAALARR